MMYDWSQRVDHICTALFILCALLGLIMFASEAFEWLAPLLVTGVGVASGQRYFNRRHAEPVNLEIARHVSSFY